MKAGNDVEFVFFNSFVQKKGEILQLILNNI